MTVTISILQIRLQINSPTSPFDFWIYLWVLSKTNSPKSGNSRRLKGHYPFTIILSAKSLNSHYSGAMKTGKGRKTEATMDWSSHIVLMYTFTFPVLLKPAMATHAMSTFALHAKVPNYSEETGIIYLLNFDQFLDCF